MIRISRPAGIFALMIGLSANTGADAIQTPRPLLPAPIIEPDGSLTYGGESAGSPRVRIRFDVKTPAEQLRQERSDDPRVVRTWNVTPDFEIIQEAAASVSDLNRPGSRYAGDWPSGRPIAATNAHDILVVRFKNLKSKELRLVPRLMIETGSELGFNPDEQQAEIGTAAAVFSSNSIERADRTPGRMVLTHYPVAIAPLGEKRMTLVIVRKPALPPAAPSSELSIAAPPGHAASDPFARALSNLDRVSSEGFQKAVRDLIDTFPSEYPDAAGLEQSVTEWADEVHNLRGALMRREETALARAAEWVEFQRRVLLSNPLLRFDRLLVIRRKPHGDPRRAEDPDRGLGKYIGLPQQSSWQLHTMPDASDWDNEIATINPLRWEEDPVTVFQSPGRRLVSDMDLHFDAGRILFSMPAANGVWQLFETDVDRSGLRQLTGDPADVHNFDGCYLPNGKIAFVSTAAFQGVPCNPGVTVGMTYLLDPATRQVRQLCFEQDHNYNPTLMNDGRILYLRWEYTDIPHVWARFLFTMNPDGTNQREYYGSGSYWPNAIFYARPVPNHPTKVIGIVTGHHVGRVGEMVLFDPAFGRESTEGAIQRIPGHGKPVKGLIQDKLTMNSWPKFVHPFPLSEKYFLTAAKPGPEDLWGIYLADIFDNLVLLKEVDGHALLEPIPLRPVKRPPPIPDRTDPSRRDALVYIPDLYTGPGLAGVPRGAVKKLRLFSYQFGYHGVAGIHHRVGADGPWEPKRILGTVPVEPDGSASFHIPANTPLSIQPLDKDGQALQLMRSWMTAMPGENVSCSGCHEKQNSAPPNVNALALRRQPSKIEPWFGAARGFDFDREVQPLLDRHCAGCHDGKPQSPEPELRRNPDAFVCYKNSDPAGTLIRGVPREQLVRQYGGVFSPAYIALRRFVRVGGLESDLRLLNPGEFRANTSELIQLLKKGHHGVRLDPESWERLFAWLDLNAPCHGRWADVVAPEKFIEQYESRRELRARFAGMDEDLESLGPVPPDVQPILPESENPAARQVKSEGWPFERSEAEKRQAAAGKPSRSITLPNGLEMELVRIPAGEFVMGSLDGHPDEQPLSAVRIARAFWMGRYEVTNAEFQSFDPSHDSRFEHMSSWIFNEEGLGWPLNHPRQPVVRVSWEQAVAFCAWLSEHIGQTVALPTEAQWEYACRAGTATPFWFGNPDADFSTFANLADTNMRRMAYDARDQFSPDLLPRDDRFDDGHFVTAATGAYSANPWGLHDMHGNAFEWTRSPYLPYPYQEQARPNRGATDERVVRGGSWYDRPKRATSSFRLAYPPWQKVYNVGFRIVIEDPGADQRLSRSSPAPSDPIP